MKLAIVYDNRTLDPNLSPAWGFSCLVVTGSLAIGRDVSLPSGASERTRQGEALLFDTGGDGPRLLFNMGQMGLDVGRIKSVVLSHTHGDHTGGLGSILAVTEGVTVYIPRSFPASFKAQVGARARVVEIHEPLEIAEGIYTTGEMGRGIREQALVVETTKGLVVITGCAHPGILEMVRRAKQIGEDEVYLVLGGFHLGGVGKRGIESIIADFRRLGVRKVAPCHCTGGRAIEMFAAEYGEDCIENGVGKVLEI